VGDMDDGERGPEHEGEERVAPEEAASVSRRQALELDRRAGWAAHNWYWLVGFGVVALILGIVVASHAFGSLHALIWLSGLFLVFLGVAQLLTVGRGGDRRAHLVGALVALVGGVVLLAWPGETLKVVAVVAGVTVLAWGGVHVAAAFGRPHETRTHDLIAGIALIVLGIVMIVWPKATLTLVGLLIGIAAIVWGVTTIAAGLRLRRAGLHWEKAHARSRPAG
jgi:uncharacterized membrane protein HdeD (DUF308 family)